MVKVISRLFPLVLESNFIDEMRKVGHGVGIIFLQLLLASLLSIITAMNSLQSCIQARWWFTRHQRLNFSWLCVRELQSFQHAWKDFHMRLKYNRQECGLDSGRMSLTRSGRLKDHSVDLALQQNHPSLISHKTLPVRLHRSNLYSQGHTHTHLT